jgi:hypothetical protein
MVSFGVHLAGGFQHALWTEMNAQFTSLAAIGYQVDLSPRNVDLIHVERLAIENLH